MLKKGLLIGVLIIMASSLLAFVACSSQPIKATWIKPTVADNKISLPVSEIQNNRIVHFKVGTTAGNIAFMAYELDGKIHARANICPPCRSENFSLRDKTLVCDVCATEFDARTGNGIKGACVAFDKASVPYENSSGNLILNGNDLFDAYRDTLQPDSP